MQQEQEAIFSQLLRSRQHQQQNGVHSSFTGHGGHSGGGEPSQAAGNSGTNSLNNLSSIAKMALQSQENNLSMNDNKSVPDFTKDALSLNP
mmetsp:Transcript_22706/g.27854  ORF Transcript_22706/g.27854 Transcript_22706/m.27854 type:complete len:91 (+) Transcript_22706:3-275(+)